MITLEKKTFRILSYCDIPEALTKDSWLQEVSPDSYVEYTITGGSTFNTWLLESVEGLSTGQTILIHIDY